MTQSAHRYAIESDCVVSFRASYSPLVLVLLNREREREGDEDEKEIHFSAHTHTHVVAKYTTHTGIAVEKDKLTGRQPLHKATQSEREEREETSFEYISAHVSFRFVSFRSQTKLSFAPSLARFSRHRKSLCEVLTTAASCYSFHLHDRYSTGKTTAGRLSGDDVNDQHSRGVRKEAFLRRIRG